MSFVMRIVIVPVDFFRAKSLICWVFFGSEIKMFKN